MANKTTFRKPKKREKEKREWRSSKTETKNYYKQSALQHGEGAMAPLHSSSPPPPQLSAHTYFSPVSGCNICHGCWLACSAAPRVALASAIRRPLHLSRLHDCSPFPLCRQTTPSPFCSAVGHIHVSHLPLKFWWHDKSAAAADNVALLH